MSDGSVHFASLMHSDLYFFMHSLYTSHLKQDITLTLKDQNNYKMPFSRGKNLTTSKIPKLHPKGLENQVYNEIRPYMKIIRALVI